MKYDTRDHPHGLAVARLLLAAPGLRDALRQIVDAENLIDAKTIAREALQSIAKNV